ncbi:transporter substrate-binding domain-containing protein [Bermanella marisrubri]|uniref:ABC transporter, periplasmic domain n=1 Tax=Bermanella marisrubri TaxID=207949 RepID=Q1MZE5_9GAMM|nr:transporter substrate-binding domain-containing protein [Bermanella marisrubri]EAT11321.1 ABC transporter, periplasmic domain [Oceanobacter sp. RED65] [Bermanella marisrubri]QIZ85291.1 transporter substrate-binding domain-containing protein [Bermanella marisrubri]
MRLITVLLLFASMAVEADTLSIRADPWFPMNGQPAADKPGYMIELAKAVFEPKGIKVDYQIMPWSRSIDLVREGRFDCVVGAYKSDTRDFIFPEQHWGLDRPQFFIAEEDNWRFNGDLSDLANRKVGIIADYFYEEAFDAYAQDHKGLNFQFMTGSDPLKKNIEKFLARRIDTVLESQLVMKAKLKQMGLVGYLKSAGNLIPPVAMYIACSPALESSKQYVKWVDETTKAMKQDGRLERLLDRYGVPPWW